MNDTLDNAQYIFDPARNKRGFIRGQAEKADTQTRDMCFTSTAKVLGYIEADQQRISAFNRADGSRENLSNAADLLAKAR